MSFLFKQEEKHISKSQTLQIDFWEYNPFSRARETKTDYGAKSF